MASLNLEDIKFIKVEIPFCQDCPNFMEFTKNINEIQVETRTKIKVKQIVRVEIIGKSDDVEEARRRVGQLNNNLDQINKKIEDLEREKVQMAQVTSNMFKDNMVLMKHDLQTEIKAMNNTFEKICEQVEKLETALIGQECQDLAQSIGDESQEVKSTMTTIQDKVSNTLVNTGNLLEPMTNVISEEIKKLNINMGHALKLDIQNTGTRLKDALEKMETNIKLSNKLMTEMVNKQLQFKTSAVTNKILEMVANNIKLKENSENEDIMSDMELENFYKSEEYVNCYKQPEAHAIHTACKLGRLDVVKKLIKNGVDVNIIKEYDNFTPVMYASWQGHKAIVEYLVSKNADVNVKDYANNTALSLASGIDKDEIIKILKNHGATT